MSLSLMDIEGTIFALVQLRESAETPCDVDLMQMRQQLRRWEANLKDAVKIRRSS